MNIEAVENEMQALVIENEDDTLSESDVSETSDLSEISEISEISNIEDLDSSTETTEVIGKPNSSQPETEQPICSTQQPHFDATIINQAPTTDTQQQLLLIKYKQRVKEQQQKAATSRPNYTSKPNLV